MDSAVKNNAETENKEPEVKTNMEKNGEEDAINTIIAERESANKPESILGENIPSSGPENIVEPLGPQETETECRRSKQKSLQVELSGRSRKSKKRKNKNKGKEILPFEEFDEQNDPEDLYVDGDHCREFEVALDLQKKASGDLGLGNSIPKTSSLDKLDIITNKEKNSVFFDGIVSEPDMRHSDCEEGAELDCPIKDGRFHALMNLSIDDCTNLQSRYPIRSRRGRGGLLISNSND